jgi:hypothetical protein
LSSDERDEYLSEVFDELMKALKGEKDIPEESSVPYQVFCFPESLGNETWVYDTVTRKMIRAFNKSEVVKISEPDENDKVLVRYAGTFVKVPSEYVCDIGFN